MGNHSATELPEPIGVARATISRILHGRTAVTMELSILAGRGIFPLAVFLLEGSIAAGFVGSLAAEAPEDQAAGRVDHLPTQAKRRLEWGTRRPKSL
jgi:hypothetical protein